MSRTLEFTAIFEPAEEGGFSCFIETMPEIFSEGETLDEARENLKDAYRMMMEFHNDEG